MKLYKANAVREIRKLAKDAEAYFNDPNPTWENATYGIGGSTFRSFVGYNHPPSETYQSWVERLMKDGWAPLFDRFRKVKTRNSFLAAHKGLARNLGRFWKRTQGKAMPLYQRNKVIDLLLKYVSRTDNARVEGIANTLIRFGNVPLDSYSLLAVKELFFGFVISPKPSMGDIEDEETYGFVQDQIYALMKDAKLPNLYFDFYWNKKHPNTGKAKG